MEGKWVIVGDELRMDKDRTYDELIGENGDIVICYGTFNIDKTNKIVGFKVVPIFENTTWFTSFIKIKNSGFYSPLITDYVWKADDYDIYI